MQIRKRIGGILFALVFAAGAVQARQPIWIAVPFAAGGGTDQYARLLASELTKRGIQTIVENKPGASGIVTADNVARSKPDGTTLLMSSLSILASNTVMYDKLPYNPVKSFTPVTQVAYQPTIIVGRTDLPYKNIKEMVAYAKVHPDKINRGSPGASILTNLAPVAFEGIAGIRPTHIPFNGDSPGLQAMLGGQIDIQDTSITGPLQHVKAGKMRVLGVMDTKRLPQVPDAPTFKEQGYDIEALLWYAPSAPATTPKDTVDKLNRAVNQVLVDPDFIARSRVIGMEPRGGTPQALADYVKAETQRWVPLLERLDLPTQRQ
ncbi:Bug family tripartite tricarboxylate transporter substrate binding protein [Variovorax sp. DT-64]|uniref:Bug family tripartite tricarboxylate transporter substrate binding protein n=1 Tax=Variovorax sp. DT-64 TaxID=3396160 RepID=UPI003F1CB386